MEYIWNLPEGLSLEERRGNADLSPIVLQILKSRGIEGRKEIDDFLLSSSSSFIFESDATLLKDMVKALERIILALEGDERIVIYGDYDADGITSSSLLYLFFIVYSYFKKKSVSVKVILPERLKDGYGLKVGGVEEARVFGAKLIITVDNGMSSHEAVDYANREGIDVIIIDHHSIPSLLPSAYATVNPKREDCLYPYKGFSAVALVYKLTGLLGERLLGEEERELFLKRYIDLVAIGTYQDLAPLTGENRYFVAEGIRVIEAVSLSGNTNLVGLGELLKVSGVGRGIGEDTIGFVIGPLLNAAGRIASPRLAFDLLTTRKRGEAKRLAFSLLEINRRRKEMTSRAIREASSYIEENGIFGDKIILLISSVWHQGIIGLIAQQLVDIYKRSCIVISNMGSNIYTGSARAYGSFNIGAFVSSLREYFIYSGGHSKAAGFSFVEDNLEAFKEAFYGLEGGLELSCEAELNIDILIDLEELDMGLIGQLEVLKPFGAGNPSPIFASFDVLIKSIRVSRRNCDTLLVLEGGSLEGGRVEFSLVAFNETGYLSRFKDNDRVDIAFKVAKDEKYNSIRGYIVDMRHSLGIV